MSERTGCRIQLKGIGAQKGSDVEDPHAYLEGSEEAVAKAIEEVEEILYNPDRAALLKGQQLSSLAASKSQSSQQPNPDSIYGPGLAAGGLQGPGETMEVPNSIVGLLIGRGGEQIQRLQNSTGANMQIQKEIEMAPGATMRVVTLKGTFEQRSELRKRIDEIVSSAMESRSKPASQPSSMTHPFVVRVAVPNDKVGMVIGRQGSNLRGIMDRTRSHINVPPEPDKDNPDLRTVHIISNYLSIFRKSLHTIATFHITKFYTLAPPSLHTVFKCSASSSTVAGRRIQSRRCRCCQG